MKKRRLPINQKFPEKLFTACSICPEDLLAHTNALLSPLLNT